MTNLNASLTNRNDFPPREATQSGVANAPKNVASAASRSQIDRSAGAPNGTPLSAPMQAELSASVEEANRRLELYNQKLDIAVDSQTGVIVVKVTDAITGETLRQIPSEEALRITRNIDALTGILVDRKE